MSLPQLLPLKRRLTAHQKYKRMEKRHRREAERIVNGPKSSGAFRGFVDVLQAIGVRNKVRTLTVGGIGPAVRNSPPEGTRSTAQ